MLDVARHIRSADFDTLAVPRGEVEEALAGMAGTTPFVLSVSFELKRVGLVPFVLESHPTWHRPARILRFAGAPDGAPLAAAGDHPATATTAALVHLAAHRIEWDVLMLDVRERPVRTRTSLRLAKLPFSTHDFPGELGDDPTTRFVVWSQPTWKSWPLRLDPGLRARQRTPPPGSRSNGTKLPATPPLRLAAGSL